MFKINEKGVSRNGSHGTVVEVYTNAVVFLQDNGCKYTILNEEFTPDEATPEQKQVIANTQKHMFSGCETGFSYQIVRSESGEKTVQIKPLK